MGCFNIYRIIRLTFPLRGRTLTIYRDGVDISSELTYSWTTDGVCWTDFTTYINYTTIIPNLESDYYLRIRFSGEIPELYLDGKLYTCFSVVLDDSRRFEITSCEDNDFSFFDNVACALQIQQQMADKIACLFGIPIYYFRVLPDIETKDLTFKEYTIHGVEDIKMLRLILPDGQMPSSRPNFTDFDFDWEVDWEVELSKTHFARAFGNTAFPKQRDFIYIPMMKRMYEVNSAYDEKEGQMMWQSTTWKLGLVKWNEKTNIDYTGFEDVIDQWAVNQFDIEPEIHEQEVDSGVVDMRTVKFIPNNIMNVFMTDAVRHSITENSIQDFNINHKNISLTRNKYSFHNPGYVQYQKEFCGDCGSLSFILEHKESNFEPHPIVEIGEIVLTLSPNNISDGVMSIELSSGVYIINYIWNRYSFTSELSVWKHTLGERFNKLPLYKIKQDMYTFEYIRSITGVYNNDYSMTNKRLCKIYPYNCAITNIKLYNKPLNNDEIKIEMLKYATKNDAIVFNDNCIPFESGYGSSYK